MVQAGAAMGPLRAVKSGTSPNWSRTPEAEEGRCRRRRRRGGARPPMYVACWRLPGSLAGGHAGLTSSGWRRCASASSSIGRSRACWGAVRSAGRRRCAAEPTTLPPPTMGAVNVDAPVGKPRAAARDPQQRSSGGWCRVGGSVLSADDGRGRLWKIRLAEPLERWCRRLRACARRAAHSST